MNRLTLKKLSALLWSIVALASIHVEIARAGNGGDKGGGFAYQCNDRLYLADTIDLLQNIDESFGLADPIERIKNLNFLSDVLPELDFSKRELEFLRVGTSEKTLPELLSELPEKLSSQWREVEYLELDSSNDLEHEQVPEGCIPVQVAVQDLKSHIVSFVPKLFYKLTLFEQRLLQAHEHLVGELNESQSTLRVRALVSSLASWIVADYYSDTAKNLISHRRAYIYASLDLRLRALAMQRDLYFPHVWRGIRQRSIKDLTWGGMEKIVSVPMPGWGGKACDFVLGFRFANLSEKSKYDICKSFDEKDYTFGDLLSAVTFGSRP